VVWQRLLVAGLYTLTRQPVNTFKSSSSLLPAQIQFAATALDASQPSTTQSPDPQVDSHLYTSPAVCSTPLCSSSGGWTDTVPKWRVVACVWPHSSARLRPKSATLALCMCVWAHVQAEARSAIHKQTQPQIPNPNPQPPTHPQLQSPQIPIPQPEQPQQPQQPQSNHPLPPKLTAACRGLRGRCTAKCCPPSRPHGRRRESAGTAGRRPRRARAAGRRAAVVGQWEWNARSVGLVPIVDEGHAMGNDAALPLNAIRKQ